MDKSEPFIYGTCTVPDGKKGDWQVSTVKLAEEDVFLANLRRLRDNPIMYVPPGTYRKLTYRPTEGKPRLVMSNTPMEIETAMPCFLHATGSVLINGLGLGMVLEGLLHKDDVNDITVIESEKDVIDLVGSHFIPHIRLNGRLKIIHADAYTWEPPKGARWNYVWHDIWDDISDLHLPLMAKLTRKYARRADKQGVWAKSMAQKLGRDIAALRAP